MAHGSLQAQANRFYYKSCAELLGLSAALCHAHEIGAKRLVVELCGAAPN